MRHPSIDELVKVLSRFEYRFSCEDELQQGVDGVLESEGIPHAREVRLDARTRLDFMCGRIAIECKVDGSLSNLTRQVHRYLQDERVEGAVIVTSRSRHVRIPSTLLEKPVRVVWVS